MSGPRVLVVMAAQWPRALLRAALREAGYDASAVTSLDEALVYGAENRQPLRLLVLDHNVVTGPNDPLLSQFFTLQPDALTLKLERVFGRTPSRNWPHVLHYPISIADIVRSAQSLLPLTEPVIHIR